MIEPYYTHPPLIILQLTKETPSPSLSPAEVFLRDPATAFITVSSARPTPQGLEDGTVYTAEDSFTHHMPMVVSPTPNFRIELLYYLRRRLRYRSPDRFSDVIQEDSDVLLRWLDEQLSIAVLAHMLSEEVEAVRDVRDSGLLR